MTNSFLLFSLREADFTAIAAHETYPTIALHLFRVGFKGWILLLGPALTQTLHPLSQLTFPPQLV